jgi:hypothetical protein
VPEVADPYPLASKAVAEPVAEDRVAVLRAYDGYQASFATALAEGSFESADLKRYVGDPLLSELEMSVDFYRRMGVVHKGQPAWRPTVTELRSTGPDRSATIVDCFDSTAWEPVFRESGESAAAPDQAQRYVITSTATYVQDHGWLITQSDDGEGGQTC